MPDITMCKNDNCLLSKSCYRHIDSGTKPNMRQSFAYFESRFVGLSDHEPNHPGIECEHYWPTVGEQDD